MRSQHISMRDTLVMRRRMAVSVRCVPGGAVQSPQSPGDTQVARGRRGRLPRRHSVATQVSASRVSQCGNTSAANIGLGRSPGGAPMTVHCEGDCRLLEQRGEKQDFEAELSRLGLGHDEFTLHVLRQGTQTRNPGWSQSYSVTVTHVLTGRSCLYQGGPGREWAAQFTRDLANIASGPFSAQQHSRRP